MKQTYRERIESHKARMAKTAMDRYNQNFDNASYLAATSGKSARYANALIDEAMALCGHPAYKVSYRNWSEDALRHLSAFA